MSYLANFQELGQLVPLEVLFLSRKRIQWAEPEKVPIAVIYPDPNVALRELLETIQNWSKVGASTVRVSQVEFEWPERLHTPVADLKAFNDYKLMVSSATSFEPDEVVDVLEQFDEDWRLGALDRAQGRFCVNEEISDEMIAAGMLEHDFVVQMPPVREYTLRVRIRSIEKATPHIVEPEDI
jgi:hypothetical protein